MKCFACSFVDFTCVLMRCSIRLYLYFENFRTSAVICGAESVVPSYLTCECTPTRLASLQGELPCMQGRASGCLETTYGVSQGLKRGRKNFASIARLRLADDSETCAWLISHPSINSSPSQDSHNMTRSHRQSFGC
jgi:hypothetical protein